MSDNKNTGEILTKQLVARLAYQVDENSSPQTFDTLFNGVRPQPPECAHVEGP